MIRTILISYPHGVTIIGKRRKNPQSNAEFKSQTANGFQIWLEKNYSENDDINLGISMLYKTKANWKKSAHTYQLRDSYEESMSRLELFSGKVIEVIVGE